MKFKCFVFLMAVSPIWLGVAVAQDYRATVQGVVTDSSQAVVVGAPVALLNVHTGITTTRVSNSTGQYRFDFVEPGTYTVTAVLAGFTKAVQENVVVQTRADITVNFSLKPGGTTETITVTANAVTLQFNTSTKEWTVDRKQLMELPVMGRSPFTLALLDPGVVDAYGPNRPPYYMWAAGGINVGGNTARQNDLLIDGAPVQIGPKGSYTPTMDAVQEFSIQQNSVDAEYGHSAGGIINVAMREGTNSIHGTAYYFGRNPALNAVPNSITHAPSLTRNHDWGGTVGGPIKKNRLFTFLAYEGWKTKDPATSYFTMPTDAERTGDFSKSLNASGGLRTIYDPYTTQFDAANNVATRQPFAGNIIPAARMDPTAQKMMQYLWGPNNPGDTVTGINNFKKSYSNIVDYWNFSDRTDWNVSDKLKIFGRYSRFHTQIGLQDFTPNHSVAMPNGAGGLMASRNIAGDAVYTINPTTIVNFRFSYAGFADDYNAPDQKFGQNGLGQLWSNNAWYQPYLNTVTDIYFPALTIGTNSFGRGSYWIQEPHSYNVSAKVAKSAGKHNLKMGVENRREVMIGVYPNLMGFNFQPAITANTFLSPNTNVSGDAYASFLLGGLIQNSYASSLPTEDVSIRYYGAYFQDDFKISRNVTLNLGLRYEYETAPVDAQNRYTRYVDLTNPIPEMQANPPAIPSSITQLRKTPVALNGAWLFADSNNRTPFNAPKFNLAPRAGVAVRLNDRTALLAGYGRFLVPSMTVQNGLIAAPNFPGYSVTSNTLPLQAGIPQSALSNPFPSSTNPLQSVTGNRLGRYTNLGNGGTYRKQDYHYGVHDRFNITLQRELPGKIKLDTTFFMTFARNLDSLAGWDTFPANNADPSYVYSSLKGQAYATVANPFYQYLTPDKFPGQLRNRATVSVLDLLRPYPQYGDLEVTNVNNGGQRYKALQLKLQRTYANGFSALWAYNYNRSQLMWYRNDIDYYNWSGVYRNDDAPRHRMNFSGTYDLPFGKGRPLLNHANPLVNVVFGGWSFSSLLTMNSGKYQMFWDDIVVSGDPAISNPTPQHGFNTNAFAELPAFTPRTAPLVYDGVKGPMHWNIDSSLVKNFQIREGMKLECRAEAYNLTNSFIWSDQDAGFWNSTFGRSTGQFNTGRQMQYTLRLIF